MCWSSTTTPYAGKFAAICSPSTASGPPPLPMEPPRWRFSNARPKRAHAFRVVIVDAVMPEMDGWELAETIRADAAHAGCAIIVLIPASQAGIADRYRRLRAIQFLTKPAKHAELIEAVRAAVGEDRPELSVGNAVVKTVRQLEILLAEDGPVNQEVAVGLLEMRGHHVEVAGNGREAIAALERRRFDAVLMDLEMPEMDGLQATAMIRSEEAVRGGRIPIIAMTAHAMTGCRDRCLEAGMDGYITKPITPAEMFQALETVCQSNVCKIVNGSVARRAGIAKGNPNAGRRSVANSKNAFFCSSLCVPCRGLSGSISTGE